VTTTGRGGPALVVIDMQNDYCHADGVFAAAGLRIAELDDLVRQVNSLVAAARAADRPVFWVRMEWTGDSDVGLLAERSSFLRHTGLRAGEWGSRLLAGLDRRPHDHEVVKTRFSAFHRTPLELLLARLGVDTLVLAGVRTDFCVESTARDAFFRDLRVVIAREAVAGYVDELHGASLRVLATVFANVVPVSAAAGLLRGVSAAP
jgi:ureidoacrylate peracid hydrolase